MIIELLLRDWGSNGVSAQEGSCFLVIVEGFDILRLVAVESRRKGPSSSVVETMNQGIDVCSIFLKEGV